MTRPRHTVLTGTVTSFDDPRGIGVVTADDGTEYPFHCTAVADGSRQVAEGTAVSFVARPGHLGRYEARDLAPAT